MPHLSTSTRLNPVIKGLNIPTTRAKIFVHVASAQIPDVGVYGRSLSNDVYIVFLVPLAYPLGNKQRVPYAD